MRELLEDYRHAVAQQGLWVTWRVISTLPIRLVGAGLALVGERLMKVGT